MSLDKLYPVNQSAKAIMEMVEEALEESAGEITTAIQNMMDGLTKAERAEDLANYYHRLDAEARAVAAKVDPIIMALEAEKELMLKRRDRVRQWLGMAVRPGTSIITEKVAVWYRESTAVNITDESAIPIEYTRVKTEADKREIMKALKDGKEVPGASLQVNYSLQVEHPGEKAKANAKARARKRAEKTVDQANSLGEA
jgi:Siphovirus Gp157.